MPVDVVATALGVVQRTTTDVRCFVAQSRLQSRQSPKRKAQDPHNCSAPRASPIDAAPWRYTCSAPPSLALSLRRPLHRAPRQRSQRRHQSPQTRPQPPRVLLPCAVAASRAWAAGQSLSDAAAPMLSAASAARRNAAATAVAGAGLPVPPRATRLLGRQSWRWGGAEGTVADVIGGGTGGGAVAGVTGSALLRHRLRWCGRR